MLLNAQTAQIEDVNPFLIELLGYPHEELLGKKLWDIGAFKDTTLNMEAFVELQTKRYIRYDNLPLEAKDGRRIPVEFVSNLYDCEGTHVIQCNIRDNTKRHLADIALKATARALQMLSESNEALLSATTEEALFSEYCRIAVETGGYCMAWVGLADNGPEKVVVPLAQYGVEGGYLELANVTWAETERGNSPVGRAIRTGQVQFGEDMSTDPTMASSQDEAMKRGGHSIIALPLRLSDGTMACLELHGETHEVWSAPERKLLKELSADLAFGVDALRTAIAKTRFQEGLRVSLEQIVQVIANTIDERDSYTGSHQRRVAQICSQIAVLV